MPQSKFWLTEPDGELTIRVGENGISAKEPQTVCEMFKSTVHHYGDQDALKYQKDGIDSAWETITWQEYYDAAEKFGKSLISLGFAPHRCINIIGFNSVEWFISQMGSILAGGIAAGIYTTNLPEACCYISNHSEAEVVVVRGSDQLMKYVSIAGKLGHLKAIVVYGEKNPSSVPDCPVPVYSWDDFLELGKDVANSVIEDRINAQKAGHCCCLIYTSGTTGTPKAVMISHDNVTWTTSALLTAFKVEHIDKVVSYLPLSHIAAQILDIFGPMQAGACTYFAQPDALKGSLKSTLTNVRPTIFFGVPRVWEKIYERMQEIGRSNVGLRKQIASWAKGKGSEHSRMIQYGGGGGNPCGYGIANKVVFSKVKESLGLNKARACFTAAAPISVTVLEYFASLDLPIYEVYGQSECTGPHTVSLPSAWKIGSTGRPLIGTETKILSDTREICERGRHIFMGYMKDPEKTAETIDEDGWLHTGDIGEFDDDDDPNVLKPSGFLSITGRIKELIITAGGENVAPIPVEDRFKDLLPALSNCMLIGDKRKYLTILLTMKTELDPVENFPTNKLSAAALDTCKKIGSSATTVEEVIEDEKWHRHIEEVRVLANSYATSNAQNVQKYSILPIDFSERGGELTPTLKLKRGATEEKYKDIIEKMYSE